MQRWLSPLEKSGPYTYASFLVASCLSVIIHNVPQYKFASGCSMTDTESNPPIEAEQTNLSGFQPSFYWPDYVSNLGRRRLDIYFYHVQGGQRNVRIISVTVFDISDVFQDYMNLVEFISSRHMPSHRGIA